MMTLDEAFTKICSSYTTQEAIEKQQDLVLPFFAELKDDPRMHALLIQGTSGIWNELMQLGTSEGPASDADLNRFAHECKRALASFFVYGIAVGREMERVDLEKLVQ